MLETFRKQTKSIVIYVFFGIIIAVFVINFGPQSQGGCTGSELAFAARVNGTAISESAFRYGLVLSGAANMPPAEARLRRIRESVMDRLLEREILADEAQKIGLAVSDQEAVELVSSGSVIALGQRTAFFKNWFFNKDGAFDYDRFKNTLRSQFGITPKTFMEHQKRELLAEKYRDLVRQAARVSEEETREEYITRQLQVDLEYVRLSGRKLASLVTLLPAEIDAYLAKDREKVKERYHTRKFLYKDKELAAVEREIAEDLLRESKGTELAQQKAEEFRKRLNASEKWEDMFPEAPNENDDDAEEETEGSKEAAAVVPAGSTAPTRKSTGLFPRRGEVVPGIGVSSELMHDAFQLRPEQPLATKNYQIADSLYLVRLKTRQEANPAEFEAKKSEIQEELATKRAEELLAELSLNLCKQAKKTVNQALVSYEDSEGDGYQPCSMLGAR